MGVSRNIFHSKGVIYRLKLQMHCSLLSEYVPNINKWHGESANALLFALIVVQLANYDR